MAKLSFRLVRDNDQVNFRELTIGDPASDIRFFHAPDLSVFTTADRNVFTNESSIDIIPRTRTIKVVVRADAMSGDGWELTFSLSGVNVTLQPIRESADNGGRANFEGTRQWPKPTTAVKTVATVSGNTGSLFDLSSAEELVELFVAAPAPLQSLAMTALRSGKRRQSSKAKK
jgi:hypothetical protein